jgi:hypothetical protein
MVQAQVGLHFATWGLTRSDEDGLERFGRRRGERLARLSGNERCKDRVAEQLLDAIWCNDGAVGVTSDAAGHVVLKSDQKRDVGRTSPGRRHVLQRPASELDQGVAVTLRERLRRFVWCHFRSTRVKRGLDRLGLFADKEAV